MHADRVRGRCDDAAAGDGVLRGGDDAGKLDLILCEQHARKLTKNLAISFEGCLYQVTGHGKGYRLRGAAVTVCKGFDGEVTVLRDGRELRVERAKAEQRSRPTWKPAPDHPWRRPFKPDAAVAG